MDSYAFGYHINSNRLFTRFEPLPSSQTVASTIHLYFGTLILFSLAGIQQPVHQNSSSPQVVWQDRIDPDNMTYEELLDLGEAVGTQSRGLSQESISSLPVTKFKCGFFSRKKKRRERCVICQMEYRRGDLQMALPCKHVYCASCVARWLNINKVCPVCFAEVPGEDPKRQ